MAIGKLAKGQKKVVPEPKTKKDEELMGRKKGGKK